MPILPRESDRYPENLFSIPPSAGDEEQPRWQVLHTRPRQEKSLSRQLSSARIGFYLPLATKPSLVRGKRVNGYLPLFPGYVFLYATHDETAQAFDVGTGRIVQRLPVLNQKKLWADLSQIQKLIDTEEPIHPEESLEPGELVKVKEGSLAGLCGRIIRKASGSRFVVALDFLQRGASVLLDGSNLIPTGSYAPIE